MPRPRALDSLSPAQARRIALAAQGFLDPAPAGAVDRRHLRRVLGRLGLLQMDSVNVLQRAHYLPLYSRLGPYPTQLLDRAAYRGDRELFEYWGHEASLLPIDLHPFLRWRMATDHPWGGVSRLAQRQRGLVDWVRNEVIDNGPLTAAQIEADVPRRTGNWGWNWSETKIALEWLFWRGEVLVDRRNSAFARVYDIPERILPASVLRAPTPEPAEAYRELVRRSALSLGVAAEPDLRDYFRLPVRPTRTAIADLVEAGELIVVSVAGWRTPVYLHRDARLPRWVRASTLVSPFDPVVWKRDRAQRLFDFSYRIEIYTPAAQRVYGYYVLPFLLGDRLVARVDLKADRAASVLRVPAAWAEPKAPPETAAALAAELHRLAGWLGLAEVAAPERGDLAGSLWAELDAQPEGGAGVV
ncbi:winged helix-turn-helix domain-containing protein [Rugosimonospora acidiphila]|uniref:Winged helix-turn-helix domain-containing protein n=2 Tax=Rugosimonospora acidiphila TaxID=556531 RepID=A0ABP9RPI1_9ACTN